MLPSSTVWNEVGFRLDGLRQRIPWCEQLSLPDIHRLLERLDIHSKRGRARVFSPDLDDDRKLALVRQAQRWAAREPWRVVLLSEDELTSSRCPSVAADDEFAGRDGPRAKHGPGAEQLSAHCRVPGCLQRPTAVRASQPL